MSEQAVESCELGLSVCSAAHAAEVGDCEVSGKLFHRPKGIILLEKLNLRIS